MDHKILCVEKVREKSIILIGHRERAAILVNDWKHRPLLMLVACSTASGGKDEHRFKSRK